MIQAYQMVIKGDFAMCPEGDSAHWNGMDGVILMVCTNRGWRRLTPFRNQAAWGSGNISKPSAANASLYHQQPPGTHSDLFRMLSPHSACKVLYE